MPIFTCISSNNPLRERFSYHISLPLNTSLSVSKSKELSYIAPVKSSMREEKISSNLFCDLIFLAHCLSNVFHRPVKSKVRFQHLWFYFSWNGILWTISNNQPMKYQAGTEMIQAGSMWFLWVRVHFYPRDMTLLIRKRLRRMWCAWGFSADSNMEHGV